MNKAAVTMGIDIGGTTTSLGFVDRVGNCLVEDTFPTIADDPAVQYVTRLATHIREAYEKISETHEMVGIGVGAPNANYYKGTVEIPPNLKWEGITDLAGLIQQHYSVPVAITNDANAAALGEMKFGAAQNLKHFIVITLGTGLGSGIVVNGDLVYGHDGFAGEIGHTTVEPDGRACGCGKRGCLEAYVSATGICRTMLEIFADSREDSELRKVSPEELTSKMIFDAAEKGDVLAIEAFQRTGRTLGIKLADAVAHTSPEAIILFGGLALAGAYIFDPTQKAMEDYLFCTFKGKVRLLLSGLVGKNAAILGASALIWNELEKKKEC